MEREKTMDPEERDGGYPTLQADSLPSEPPGELIYVSTNLPIPHTLFPHLVQEVQARFQPPEDQRKHPEMDEVNLEG